MSRKLHIVPGLNDCANGMAVVARLIAKARGDSEVVDLNHGLHRIRENDVAEIWVHGMWLPKEWLACWETLKCGKRLVRMLHGCADPVRLKFHGWRKWLVGPIERWCLRRCDRIVATCETEKGWIERYLGRHCPPVEVTDIKRFFDLNRVGCVAVGNDFNRVERVETCRVWGSDSGRVETCRGEDYVEDGELHLLYLGRRHPLKGLEYLEEAIRQIQDSPRVNTSAPSASPHLCVRIVSDAFGEKLEKIWDWCDVLVLPTLSENFGLVVAEALERGKRVITTDGAPAWGDGNDYGGRLVYLKGYRDGASETRVSLLREAIGQLMKRRNHV